MPPQVREREPTEYEEDPSGTAAMAKVAAAAAAPAAAVVAEEPVDGIEAESAADKELATKQASRNPISRFLFAFLHLFFQRKFATHRIFGLLYLIQYAAAIYLFVADYEAFLRSPLIITLPITGVLQTITAIYTFTFLPKKTKNPGYFNDKDTMSYPFIKENLFFAALLAFQWLYYNDAVYPYFKKFFVVEYLFVFLPYCFRFLFAKTRMRDGLAALKPGMRYYTFYYYATYTTKIFYIWAKHYIGFFLNYLRFLDLATQEDKYHVFMLLLSACSATTIAMFLHTLRFKRYTNGPTSFGTYMVAYLSTFIGYALIFPVFFHHPVLFAITFGGILMNLLHNRAFDLYQVGIMLAFHKKLIQPFITA